METLVLRERGNRGGSVVRQVGSQSDPKEVFGDPPRRYLIGQLACSASNLEKTCFMYSAATTFEDD
jgi:hypothetical protein